MSVTTARPQQALSTLVPRSMDEAFRMAEMMAKAKLVPGHLQGSVADCLLVVEAAMRWQMSPFAVAQCTSSIHGRLMYEGKLVAAAVESLGAIEGHFDYEFSGAGDDRTITVRAKRTGDKEPREVSVALKNARTANEHWKKQADQQLVYHATRVWARRWTPSVILGVYTRDEFESGDVPLDAFDGTTIDASPEQSPADIREEINRSVPLKDAPAPPVSDPEPPPVAAAAPPRTKPSVGEWLENTIKPLLAQAQSFGGIDLVLERDDVRAALGSPKFSDAQRQALNALVADARLHLGETLPVQADVPEASDDWPGPDVPAAAPPGGSS